jgi:mannobiose 2-epimerase
MRRPALAFLTFLVACASPNSSVGRPASEHARDPISAALTREHRRALADTIRRSLRDDLLAAWYPRTIDLEYGGFLSQWEFDWTPSGAQDKMIVTQARHTWTTARASQHFPADTLLRSAAAHGFRFLRDRMWDRQHGGFYWLVTRDGTPKAEDGRILKQAYGEAFAIYALAAYYDVSRDTAALRLAQDTFRWLDAHAHDAVHRGYFNYLERDGTPLREGLGRSTAKDQNSSIHLLEAFTELYRVWPDAALRDRLREMLELIRDRIVVEPGTLTLFSRADWTPVSYRDSSEAVRRADRYHHDHVSFGHDVETAYLLLEAAEALGLGHDERTLRVAKRMLDHSLRTGWDTAVGGFYEAGYYHRGQSALSLVDDTKNWWAQAEGLNTLLIFGDLYPNDALRYHQRFLTQWRYITEYLIDHEHGGWYAGGIDKQPAMRRALKGQIWKAAYHDGRALMNVSRRLAQPGGAP